MSAASSWHPASTRSLSGRKAPLRAAGLSFAARRSNELTSIVGVFLAYHAAWVDDNNRSEPDNEYWDTLEALGETFAGGSIPADCRNLAKSVDALMIELDVFDNRADAAEGYPHEQFWRCVESLQKCLQNSAAAPLKPLESIRTLRDQKVEDWQIAKIWGFIDHRGEPMGHLVQQEIDKPGCIIGSASGNPDAVVSVLVNGQKWVDPRIAQRAAGDVADESDEANENNENRTAGAVARLNDDAEADEAEGLALEDGDIAARPPAPAVPAVGVGVGVGAPGAPPAPRFGESQPGVRNSALARKSRLAAAAKAPCPESPRDLFNQNVSVEQSAKMLCQPVEAVAKLFGGFEAEAVAAKNQGDLEAAAARLKKAAPVAAGVVAAGVVAVPTGPLAGQKAVAKAPPAATPATAELTADDL